MLLSVPDEMAKPEQGTTALRDEWPHAAVEQLDRQMSLMPADFDYGCVSRLMRLLQTLKVHYQSLVTEELSASLPSVFTRLFRRGGGPRQRNSPAEGGPSLSRFLKWRTPGTGAPPA